MSKDKDLEKREAEVAAKEVAVAKAVEMSGLPIDNVPVDPALTKMDRALIAKGMKAFGIEAKWLLKGRMDKETGEAVLITNGGAKVRFRDGDKPEKLEPIRVDGVIRKKSRKLTPGPKRNSPKV